MTPDALLDALLAAVKAGDKQAAAFLPSFTRWYLGGDEAPPPEFRCKLATPWKS